MSLGRGPCSDLKATEKVFSLDAHTLFKLKRKVPSSHGSKSKATANRVRKKKGQVERRGYTVISPSDNVPTRIPMARVRELRELLR